MVGAAQVLACSDRITPVKRLDTQALQLLDVAAGQRLSRSASLLLRAV